jgi:hypothetical protein
MPNITGTLQSASSVLRVKINGQKYEAVSALSKGGDELSLSVVDLPSITLKQVGGFVMVERAHTEPLRVRPDVREVRAAASGADSELLVVTLVLAPVPDEG